MKKKFTKTTVSLLLAGMMVAAAGCGKNSADNTADTSSTKNTESKTTEAAKEETKTADTKETKEETTQESTDERGFNDDGTFPVCKEQQKLNILIAENSGVEDYETNFETTSLEKDGNFDLTFTKIPAADFKTKVNLMIASGDELPDIICSGGSSSTRFSDTEVYNFALAGAVVPLTDYYKNGFYLKEAVERTGVDFTKQVTSPDGQIYGIPAYNQSISNEYPSKLYMYQEWLDKVGMTAPTTPDELYQVLKAFKEKDPNGNGQQDEIPLVSYAGNISWFQYIMNAYQFAGNASTDFLVVKDGKLDVSYTQEGYKQGLQFIKKLVDEELVSPLSLTQDAASEKALLASTPTIIGAFCQAGPSDIPADDIRRTQYVGVGPLTGADGHDYAVYAPSVAQVAFMVTKDCKNPEAAFKLGDLLISERYSIMTRWGEENVDWKHPEAGAVGLYSDLGYEPSLVEVLPWGKLQNKHWASSGPFIRQYSIAAGVVWSGNELDTAPVIAKAQHLYMDKHPDEYVTKLIYTLDEAEAIADIQSTLQSYLAESRAAFITGSMDIEKDWQSYLDQVNSIGLPTLVENAQKAYDRMK